MSKAKVLPPYISNICMFLAQESAKPSEHQVSGVFTEGDILKRAYAILMKRFVEEAE